MHKILSIITAPARFLVQAAAAVLTSINHPRGGWGWSLLNQTGINYQGLVRADANSIVEACVGWAQRNFSEAPPVLEEWNTERQDWDVHQREEMLNLLEHPNDFYDADTMWSAIIADLMLDGNAYLIAIPSRSGNRILQLWWAPHSTMEPKDDPRDPAVFISHYAYTPGSAPVDIPVSQVIHFRDGMDPDNPRKGQSPMKCLFREIYTDDEAANMTASLLRNMGVPGVIISPAQGTMSREAAEGVKESYMEKFSGDKKGEPMVMAGATKIEQFGFSPEQMQLRSLRGIPEERITARVGINSAVLGLGAGLATTKVGATLREYREEAFESFMVPMWKRIGRTLTHQLLPFFKGADWRASFDLSKVRVLQEDEQKRAESLSKQLLAGGITRAEFRHDLGRVIADSDKVYYLPKGVVPVADDLSPEDQRQQMQSTPLNPMDVVETVRELVERR